MPLVTSLDFDGPQWDEFEIEHASAFNRTYYFKDDNGEYADMAGCSVRMDIYDGCVISESQLVLSLNGIIVGIAPAEVSVIFDLSLENVQLLPVTKTQGYLYVYINDGSVNEVYIKGNVIFKGFL